MSVAQLQRISLPFSVAAFRDAHSSLFMPEDHRQNVFRRSSFMTCTLPLLVNVSPSKLPALQHSLVLTFASPGINGARDYNTYLAAAR